MGVTNENFPNEREDNSSCATNATPESDFAYQVGSITASDITAFRAFMRFLDQPAPVDSFENVSSQSIQQGASLFASTGCALCHTPSLPTGLSATRALSNKQANLFSDLAVHHMGPNLADGITQGTAGPDEFRTAPLWGVGQRIFFLHDGRTKDLLQAIEAHASNPGRCGPPAGAGPPIPCNSEANGVINNFNGLSTAQKQAILDFLRAL
jgi:CxxC motif-containing protein (DUF1111 family)